MAATSNDRNGRIKTNIGLTQGLLHLPGATYESRTLVEKLLLKDRENHHCFWGKAGFHNHLNHHLLAAYDFGAPPKTLQAIYDAEVTTLSPINLLDRKEQVTGSLDVVIDGQNWTQFLGVEKYYIAYVDFFKAEIAILGVHDSLETYVFSPKANGNDSVMLMRFVGGALHPLIQVGYGIEFNDPSIVAAGLAQTAVSRPIPPVLHEVNTTLETATNGASFPRANIDSNNSRWPRRGHSLLSIISEVYSSEVLHPVMPYDPDGLLSKRMRDAMVDGRPEEIRRLASLWIDTHHPQIDFDEKVEETIWAATLLTFSTGKNGRKPRLDFFLMHILTSSLFLPSFLTAISSSESKARLLKAVFMALFAIIIVRGRPRIDASLLMSYPDYPQPPKANTRAATPSKDLVGDPRDKEHANSWSDIVASAIHAPDAHTVKSLRTLYYAAQRYGTTPPGGAVGAFNENGEETLKGTSNMDGTIFIRAAGILMDTMGWVTHGQLEGNWDRSALGWDEAWNNSD